MISKKFTFCHVSIALAAIMTVTSAHAAVSIDRTRVIFDAKNSAMGITLNNNSDKDPYLAQSWIEDDKGNKSVDQIVVLPPLQRIEPKSKAQIKFQALPGAIQLPQDRESVFYLNVREIPPKTKKQNSLQIALQTKIKLFYRPSSISVSKSDRPWQEKITIKHSNGIAVAVNPTPYYITVVEAKSQSNAAKNKSFEPFMVAPFSEAPIKSLSLKGEPVLTYINDYGGAVDLSFTCKSDICQVVLKN
ncbi:fimbria/pilus periplasmic chaperone [Plesiomonas sp.]|uniref:fimbria/pilus periplasmic chaperone n=1 Tax=Plesiomonas sp. TaxID=2486279 RepID=UPI003F30EC10